ncbi:MAG: Mut7-C RNAse domain-containing protein [Pseudomonadota bacterium]
MSSCRQRFLCDEMLARLGRWLRAAGYDVVIAAPGEGDKTLLQQARSEQRMMLSRDRKLLEYRDAAAIVSLLSANQLHGQLEELSNNFSIDWLCCPFSRCLVCNSVLIPASSEVIARVPREALREDETVLYCSSCDQPYWHGSHVRRMRQQLDNFSRGVWNASVEDDAMLLINEKIK